MTDSPAFRPLHSLPHSASLHRQDALARSDGRKLARQSGTARALPKTPRAARLRPATAAAVWARCSACRPGQDRRHSRETDQLSLARNRSDSLSKPNWSETSASGCTRNCRSRPCTLASQFSRSALPPKTQKFWLRAGATAPGIESSSPSSKAIGYAAGWHERPARLTVLLRPRLWPRLANRQLRQHTLCVRSAPASLHYFILIAPTILTREPLWGGIKLRTMWRCLPCRCGAVTARAPRTSHSSGALEASAARTAPACRHRSRQPPLRLNRTSRGCLPQSPHPSPMLDPFRPQVVFAGN